MASAPRTRTPEARPYNLHLGSTTYRFGKPRQSLDKAWHGLDERYHRRKKDKEEIDFDPWDKEKRTKEWDDYLKESAEERRRIKYERTCSMISQEAPQPAAQRSAARQRCLDKCEIDTCDFCSTPDEEIEKYNKRLHKWQNHKISCKIKHPHCTYCNYQGQHFRDNKFVQSTQTLPKKGVFKPSFILSASSSLDQDKEKYTPQQPNDEVKVLHIFDKKPLTSTFTYKRDEQNSITTDNEEEKEDQKLIVIGTHYTDLEHTQGKCDPDECEFCLAEQWRKTKQETSDEKEQVAPVRMLPVQMQSSRDEPKDSSLTSSGIPSSSTEGNKKQYPKTTEDKVDYFKANVSCYDAYLGECLNHTHIMALPSTIQVFRHLPLNLPPGSSPIQGGVAFLDNVKHHRQTQGMIDLECIKEISVLSSKYPTPPTEKQAQRGFLDQIGPELETIEYQMSSESLKTFLPGRIIQLDQHKRGNLIKTYEVTQLSNMIHQRMREALVDLRCGAELYRAASDVLNRGKEILREKLKHVGKDYAYDLNLTQTDWIPEDRILRKRIKSICRDKLQMVDAVKEITEHNDLVFDLDWIEAHSERQLQHRGMEGMKLLKSKVVSKINEARQSNLFVIRKLHNNKDIDKPTEGPEPTVTIPVVYWLEQIEQKISNSDGPLVIGFYQRESEENEMIMNMEVLQKGTCADLVNPHRTRDIFKGNVHLLIAHLDTWGEIRTKYDIVHTPVYKSFLNGEEVSSLFHPNIKNLASWVKQHHTKWRDSPQPVGRAEIGNPKKTTAKGKKKHETRDDYNDHTPHENQKQSKEFKISYPPLTVALPPSPKALGTKETIGHKVPKPKMVKKMLTADKLPGPVKPLPYDVNRWKEENDWAEKKEDWEWNDNTDSLSTETPATPYFLAPKPIKTETNSPGQWKQKPMRGDNNRSRMTLVPDDHMNQDPWVKETQKWSNIQLGDGSERKWETLKESWESPLSEGEPKWGVIGDKKKRTVSSALEELNISPQGRKQRAKQHKNKLVHKYSCGAPPGYEFKGTRDKNAQKWAERSMTTKTQSERQKKMYINEYVHEEKRKKQPNKSNRSTKMANRDHLETWKCLGRMLNDAQAITRDFDRDFNLAVTDLEEGLDQLIEDRRAEELRYTVHDDRRHDFTLGDFLPDLSKSGEPIIPERRGLSSAGANAAVQKEKARPEEE